MHTSFDSVSSAWSPGFSWVLAFGNAWLSTIILHWQNLAHLSIGPSFWVMYGFFPPWKYFLGGIGSCFAMQGNICGTKTVPVASYGWSQPHCLNLVHIWLMWTISYCSDGGWQRTISGTSVQFVGKLFGSDGRKKHISNKYLDSESNVTGNGSDLESYWPTFAYNMLTSAFCANYLSKFGWYFLNWIVWSLQNMESYCQLRYRLMSPNGLLWPQAIWIFLRKISLTMSDTTNY